MIWVLFVLCLVGVIKGQSLVASPSVLQKTNSVLTVTWTGIINATSGDRINIYSPASGFTDDELMGYLQVMDVSTWHQGFGQVTMNMVNIRSTISFQYMLAKAGHTYEVVVTSNTVSFASIDEPTQGHIAFTQDPTQMRIMWVTGSNTSVATVKYGLTSDLGSTETGQSNTYYVTDLCAAPANSSKNGGWRDPGFQHDVLLQNLKLNTKYYYQFGSGSMWSTVQSFVTSPGIGSDIPIDIIMFGDMGVKVPFEIPDYWTNYGLDIQDMAPKSLTWIQRYVNANLDSPKLIGCW
jgi:hypothetical protein